MARRFVSRPPPPAYRRPVPRAPVVGLLGGSFNPAHSGHRRISEEALKRLGVGEIWWLVSPQNPLKAAEGMASLDQRLRAARAIAAPDRRIIVTDIERPLGTRATVDTLAALRRLYPRIRFIWLMGADNLIEIPRWRDWTQIFASAPVAVFTRPTYDSRALLGKAAQVFRRRRAPDGAARRLKERPTPCWAFLRFRRHPASATAIRASQAPQKIRQHELKEHDDQR